jgi:thiosulfate/3-mercaptopyruvate sulfurtransferase
MQNLADHSQCIRAFVLCLLSCTFALAARAQQGGTVSSIPAEALIQPEELARSVQSGKSAKLLILQIGSNVLYAQAHIPGSEYAGAASTESGRQQLRKRVDALARNRSIVLYCGCCPWSHCPNAYPAYRELRAMGFTQVKVLYIADNFGTDWVDKGYPTAKGE